MEHQKGTCTCSSNYKQVQNFLGNTSKDQKEEIRQRSREERPTDQVLRSEFEFHTRRSPVVLGTQDETEEEGHGSVSRPR